MEAELLNTLKTTPDSSARHEAAVSLARIHSTEATAELVTTAAGEAIAAQGLEAQRNEYIGLLTLPRKKELSQKATTCLLQTVDCLAVIHDATSVEALGTLAAAPGAYLLEVSLHAVKTLGAIEGEAELKELITCITVPADRERAREIREAAFTVLQANPDAAPLLVEVRARCSEEAI